MGNQRDVILLYIGNNMPPPSPPLPPPSPPPPPQATQPLKESQPIEKTMTIVEDCTENNRVNRKYLYSFAKYYIFLIIIIFTGF